MLNLIQHLLSSVIPVSDPGSIQDPVFVIAGSTRNLSSVIPDLIRDLIPSPSCRT